MRRETRVLILALPPADCVTFHSYPGFLLFGIKERERGQTTLNFSVLFPRQRGGQESVYVGLGGPSPQDSENQQTEGQLSSLGAGGEGRG